MAWNATEVDLLLNCSVIQRTLLLNCNCNAMDLLLNFNCNYQCKGNGKAMAMEMVIQWQWYCNVMHFHEM